MADTIYALSSGAPPAAIAVVRVSGPRAGPALRSLTDIWPAPRRLELATLRAGGVTLDRALIARFPAPASATGEDVVELHLHGGRAVVTAVLAALSGLDGLREAEPGEFTRRAFEQGQLDLTEAEGLADLLAAETETQRRAALRLAGGGLRERIEGWQAQLLAACAAVEAVLDHDGEGDVQDFGWDGSALRSLIGEIEESLAAPPAERLRDGIRLVLAGPPNSGKSTLFNALSGRDAAITAPTPGTTRDVIEAPVAIEGIPFLLTDTAGLRDAEESVERIGVERARAALTAADIVLWMGVAEEQPLADITISVQSMVDIFPERNATLHVSPVSGQGMTLLREAILERARKLIPAEGQISLNRRQREAVARLRTLLLRAAGEADLLIVAETLREARSEIDRLTGRAGVEDMLDALFARFCIGK